VSLLFHDKLVQNRRNDHKTATELVPPPLFKFCFQGNVVICIKLLYAKWLTVIMSTGFGMLKVRLSTTELE